MTLAERLDLGPLHRHGKNVLEMFTLYYRPRDYPAWECVVREWHVESGESKRTDNVWCFANINDARRTLGAGGLYCIVRQPGDDPAIVETWL